MIIRTARPGSDERRPGGLALALAAAAVAAASAAWIVYFREGLILSHYDAKAHLVVARRVIDSITPGWQQIGAVWLPLPHLIQVLPVQIDAFYRTGLSGSIVSIACFGVTVWAASTLVLRMTGSRLGAGVAATLLALNPNVLYLQVTPMTEPLLMAVTVLAVLWMYEWLQRDTDTVPRRLGWVLFAAAWTRYEAWTIVGAALAAAAWALRARGVPVRIVGARVARLAIWPAAAVLIFLVNSRVTVGSWFVSGGFYVPDPTYAGQAWRTLVGLWWGTHQLSGYVVEAVALVTAAALVLHGALRPAAGAALVPVALFASAAVPFVAFYQGHPYRIRYMVPLAAACALFCGLAVGFAGRLARTSATGGAEPGWRRGTEASSPGARGRAGVHHGLMGRYAPHALALALAGSAVVEAPPWAESTPLLAEAQWDVPLSLNRRAVTACLERQYRGGKVMASMGSLAHYMQELSDAGFDIADFVHEGTGAIWELAIETGPAPHARWMLVEEAAEGGDALAQRIRRDPAFARGMDRVCEGGNVALYRSR